MGMPFNRNSLVSLDNLRALKDHCWDNISGFYKKYKEELDMSQATFYRAVQGHYSSPEVVNKIEDIIRRYNIDLLDAPKDPWEVKKIYVKELTDMVDMYINTPTTSNLLRLRETFDSLKRKLQ